MDFLLFIFFFDFLIVGCGGVELLFRCIVDRDNYSDWDGLSYNFDCLFVYFYVNRVGVCEIGWGVVLFVWDWRVWYFFGGDEGFVMVLGIFKICLWLGVRFEELVRVIFFCDDFLEMVELVCWYYVREVNCF